MCVEAEPVKREPNRRVVRAAGLVVLCLAAAKASADQVDAAAVRAAILDLTAAFGERYPGGRGFLARLAKVEKAPDAAALAALRREALVANPLVSGRPILFVVRRQYSNNHGTEATMCQTAEINTAHFRGGGSMKVLDLAGGGKVTTVVDLPQGVARDADVHFDGRRIVLSMRRDIRDDYHLYEMRIDPATGLGAGALKQLTFGRRVSDIQPVYLPDGRIAFSSTRDPKYIPCQRHLMANLFVMNGDGSNIRQLGYNTQFEGRASLMPDGRLLYTRWEYVDKHFASAYGLWACSPDGTNHALYYGGYAWQPGAIVDARIIPGTRRFVAVFTAVHELAWGAMVVGDAAGGLDGLHPIVRSWPADITPWMRHWNTEERIGGGYDSFRAVRLKYEDPYPLSEKYFLCSRSLDGRRRQMALFLVDVFGNEVLLHAEAPGCFDPMPIAPRERPAVIPPRVDLAEGEGTFYVYDVYVGDGMDRVPRGAAKYLRIVEAPPKRTYPPWNIGDWTPALTPDSHHPVAVNWDHYNTKRVLGRVPVEADGSAHFRVPAGKFVYFQLLDAQRMMIQSMRSGTMVQPGETLGCVGCHEGRQASVPAGARKAPLALRRPASGLEPWYGPARAFSYTAEVQGVLDKHCVRCHDYGKEAALRQAHGGASASRAAALNLSGDLGPAFNVSYTSLRSRSPPVWTRPKPGESKPLVSAVGAGPIKVIPPYSWGSHRSGLIDLLRKPHHDVKLDRQALDRIVTWIDLNTPYYPTHAAYYRAHTFGRCPLDHGQLARLGALVRGQPGGAKLAWRTVKDYNVRDLSGLIMRRGSPINFTRPEHSLCLTAFADKSSPAYHEALRIIRAGKAMLARHPRADMPGFRPCEADRRQLEYCAARRQVEARTRAAIARGEKVYPDRPPG